MKRSSRQRAIAPSLSSWHTLPSAFPHWMHDTAHRTTSSAGSIILGPAIDASMPKTNVLTGPAPAIAHAIAVISAHRHGLRTLRMAASCSAVNSGSDILHLAMAIGAGGVLWLRPVAPSEAATRRSC